MCLRKSLGIVKDIYKKFSHNEGLIKIFSEMIYAEVIKDQLDVLKEKYVSEKS
jgi:hypothetical protein